MEQIVYILANIFVVFAIDKFMKVFFQKRRTKFLTYVGSCLLYPLVVGGLFLFLNIPIITLIANALVLFTMTLNFEATWKRRISAIFFIYAFMFIADVAVSSVTGYFDVSIIEQVKYDSVFGTVIVPLIIYFEALIAQNFKSIRKTEPVSVIFWASSLIIPVASIYLTILILSSSLYQIHVVSAVGAIFIINVLTFYLHDSLSAAYSDKLKTTLFAQEKEYYYNQCELMRESTEDLKAFRHDVKNHLSTLGDYIKCGESKEALDYLMTLVGNTDTNTTYSNTGNIAFDSIINYKLRNAKENGIELNVDVSILPKLSIEVSDVITIIGNLLDNSVNAVLKTEEKRIKLKINFSKGRVFINIENTFNGELKYEDNEIVSLNKNDGHGYGLRNIRKSAEKYNGYVEVTAADGLFSVDVLLYVQAD